MPYSWDTANDQYATEGQAYSFQDARKTYDDVAIAKTSQTAYYTFRSPTLTTDSPYPLIVGIDTTGSMETWPAVFFEKLPLLYKEAINYLPGCAISFQAINDYYSDGFDVALQPAPFGEGPQLDEYIGRLYPYGGGGGQMMESYEIFAAYNALLQAPQAKIKPVAIILADESLYDAVPDDVSAFFRLGKEETTTRSAFERLHRKCDLYLVRKPYSDRRETEDEIVAAWRKVARMNPEHILTIKDPRRVVDVILGILGILTGKEEHFQTELRSRQTPKQVQEVLRSLNTLKLSASQSAVTRNLSDDAPKTRRLDLDA